MTTPARPLAACLATLAAMFAGPASAAKPAVVSVRKIWDKGKHNAFTDLIRFRDKFFCTFREGNAHVGGDGAIRVLVSGDGAKWESAALLTEKGIDLRDPKFSVTPDNRLMIVAGGSVYKGGRKILGRQPRVLFSKDGVKWTAARRVLAEGDWLWRVTWHKGTAYGVSYRTSPRKTDTKTSDWLVSLYKSGDGLKWKRVTDLAVPHRPNETTLRFTPDGEMIALMRREAGSRKGWIGTAKPPYTKWKWTETKHRLGGPNFIRLSDGSLWAGSRSYPGGAKTVLAKMTTTSYDPVLTLPSGGDTSYPGLVWHKGLLWMSYYSSHQGKTSIYLAKIRVK
ncbi:MAG: exo-alpha-sialidase [Planctomycetaceae bacterium]